MALSAPILRLLRRLGALALAFAVLGLPVSDLYRYALLAIAFVFIFANDVTFDRKRWLFALGTAVVAIGLYTAWPAPRIEEGYNFYFDAPRVIADLKLPSGVADVLQKQFDAEYPDRGRCNDVVFPERPRFAFSADAIYQHPKFSRRVTGIDFSDPVHLRLGDISKIVYSGLTDRCGVMRFSRDRHSLNLFDRFHLLYPTYLVYEFPAAFAGSELCWRGTVLWPNGNDGFDTLDHATMACRPLTAGDTGRSIYAVSIKRDQGLAMQLRAGSAVQIHGLFEGAIVLAGIAAILLLLVEIRWRRLYVPAILLVLALVVVTAVDVTFIGGQRPMDDGDDGFAYEGFAREMVLDARAGDVSGALKGYEPVYYFTPGFRYFRMLERFVFGDTYLGYLSAMLAIPFVLLALFRRFMSARWALALAIIFTGIPVGTLFGSSLLHYIVWAARGFADPFAYFFLFAGVLLIVPKVTQTGNPPPLTGFAGGLLLATATFCRPNLVLASVVMVCGAALMAVTRRQWRRAFAVCAGFAALIVSPLHNLYYGHSTVLFSDNVNQPQTLLMSPLDYLKAVGEVLTFNFTGPHVVGAIHQLGGWLSGPSESIVMIPVHAAAIATLVRVGVFGRTFDPWLRIVALAALLQHGIGVSYANSARYSFGAWLLTALVSTVWLEVEGLGLIGRLWPRLQNGWRNSATLDRIGRQLDRLESSTR